MVDDIITPGSAEAYTTAVNAGAMSPRPELELARVGLLLDAVALIELGGTSEVIAGVNDMRPPTAVALLDIWLPEAVTTEPKLED